MPPGLPWADPCARLSSRCSQDSWRVCRDRQESLGSRGVERGWGGPVLLEAEQRPHMQVTVQPTTAPDKAGSPALAPAEDRGQVCRTKVGQGPGGSRCCPLALVTLKVKVSLKAGFSVFRWTLVSYFFFLSGSRKTLTYGSEVPPMSRAGSSAACRTPTVSCETSEAGPESQTAPASPPQRRALGSRGAGWSWRPRLVPMSTTRNSE